MRNAARFPGILKWRCTLAGKMKAMKQWLPLVCLLCLMSFPLQAEEILNMSILKEKIKKLSIERNIFSPDIMKPAEPQVRRPVKVAPPPIKEPPKPVVMEKNIEDETRRSVTFDGYVIKQPKNFALISVNGEFYAVGPEDIV